MKNTVYILLVSCLVSIVTIVIYDHVSKPYHAPQHLDEFSTLVSNNQLNLEGSLRSLFTSSSPTDFTSAASKGRKATVAISTFDPENYNKSQRKMNASHGSGVIISSDGYVVTNYHVIKESSNIKITTDEQKQFAGKVVGYDEFTDIALLKVEGTQLPYMAIGNSDSIQVGEWVLAVGNPYNLQSSVTAGIVSAKARDINVLQTQGIESFIQTDAAVNPGNSGGALINTNGELVGINTAIMSESGNSEGFSFAIPSNLVQKVMFDIIEFGSVQRAWMGIRVFNVSDLERSRQLSNGTKGVFIDVVEKEGAAASAGLKKDDIIQYINGSAIINKSQFTEQLALYRPGDKLSVKLLRDGKEITKTVILRNQLNTTDYISIRKDPILKKLGVELRNLDTKESRRMRRQGVYVVSVKKGSILAKTNIDPGYIITRCNEKPIETVDDLVEILNKQGKIYLEGFYENYPGDYPYIFDINI